ncbi:hypothetical protein [Mucilaginibacter sp.]|uniref:hypothetical protein n=1 Tax=Mucilaginibacter sp. TaxID=1882438 RepID=UPI003265DDF7
MKTNLIILSTDSVDRYGCRIMITALEMMLKDRMTEGIPMLFGHDQHKPIGWGKPFALYLEPNLTRLLAYQNIPTTKEEESLVLKNHNIFRSNEYFNSSKEHLEPFAAILKKVGIEGVSITNISCTTANKEDIARNLYPYLFNKEYRDELVPFSVLFEHFDYLGQGVFKDKKSELTVFAHHYFRRSESVHNTINAIFLDELIKLKGETNLDLYLRIEPSQLGYAPSFKEYLELEYQWGPKYTDEIEAIKEGLARHDCDKFEKAYYGFSRSEFLWEWDKKKQKFSFQMEELMDEEAPTNKDHFNCRYIHTVYDKESGGFEHFDGAIRTYDTYEMIERLEKDFKSYGKQSAYTKLFKINGQLQLGTWKLLVTLFLRGNPIIYEYFGLKKEIEALKAQPSEPLTIKEKLVPYHMEPTDGLRLLISYFNIPTDLSHGRFIHSFDIAEDTTKTYRCIDYYFLEFKKALMRLGEDIEIPSDVLLIKSMDNYWNIPLIMHHGEHSWELFNKTVEALKLLFGHMLGQKVDMNISVTLGIVANGKITQVSAYGNIHHLNEWINDYLPFPDNNDEFSTWLIRQRSYLEKFPYKPDRPLMSEIIQMDGVLYAKRSIVTSKYEFQEDPNGVFGWSIDFVGDEIKAIEESGLDIVPAMQVTSSVCSDTGEDYFKSGRSKWLDNDLRHVDITGYAPMLLHWAIPKGKYRYSEEKKA